MSHCSLSTLHGHNGLMQLWIGFLASHWHLHLLPFEIDDWIDCDDVQVDGFDNTINGNLFTLKHVLT